MRAPIYEEKVVDFIIELVKVTDKAVSVEELRADPDEIKTEAEAKPKAKAKAKPKAEAAAPENTSDSGAAATVSKKAAPRKKAAATE